MINTQISGYFLVFLLLVACTADNSRYQDIGNLERPPEISIDKQAAEQKTANELEPPIRRYGKGLKSDVYKVEGSQVQIKLKRTFDEAWSLLNQAILHNDLKVTDQDRSKGIYYVEYDGYGLIGSVSSLFKNDTNPPNYLLKIEPEGEESSVTASLAAKNEEADTSSPKDGNSAKNNAGQLIGLLFDTLHDKVNNN